jgi:menaquinone-dependent protoporphyrinogen oxidase
MKTLVVYSSKNGYSRECAQKIATQMGDGSEAVDIKSEAKRKNIADYKSVVIGGGVHVGHIKGALRTYCTKNKDILLTKDLGLFLCGTETNPEGQKKYFETGFPAEIVKKARVTGWFGGRIITAEHDVITRAILKKILGTSDDFRGERPDLLDEFISKLRKS